MRDIIYLCSLIYSGTLLVAHTINSGFSFNLDPSSSWERTICQWFPWIHSSVGFIHPSALSLLFILALRDHHRSFQQSWIFSLLTFFVLNYHRCCAVALLLISNTRQGILLLSLSFLSSFPFRLVKDIRELLLCYYHQRTRARTVHINQ